jgi:hypothetical protein
MTYQTPQLQLIGSATGIVLGQKPLGVSLYPDNGLGSENDVSRSIRWN